MSDHAESWKPVPGYEGHYEVSDQGRVASLKWGKRRILKPSLRSGYRAVHLSSGNVAKHLPVHRLVLLAFIGEPGPGEEACHGPNGDSDNSLANLRWGTHSANMLDRVEHGTHPKIRNSHCPNGHEYSGDNLYVSPSGWRVCRACRNAVERRRQARIRTLNRQRRVDQVKGGL